MELIVSNTPIYLDHAAATPVDELVVAAMQPFLTDQFYNPSAIYLAAKAARHSLEDARHGVAMALGARSGEIVFTAGATEANNIAIHGVMRQHKGAKVLVSSIEHLAVLEPAKLYNCTVLPCSEKGVISVDDVRSALADDVALVSVMYANNEIGTIQPLKEIAELVERARADRKARGIKLPLYLHTDAAQAANYLDISVSRLGVDLMTISAGKTYGPKQVGALYVRAGVRLMPVMQGGGQEYTLRSGTENVAGAVGLAKALDLATRRRNAESERLSKLQKIFFKELQQIADVVVHGHQERRLPNNISLSLPNIDGETAVMELDEVGIQAATGSACGASKDGPSHVLLALGVDPSVAENSLRLTMGRTTSETDMIKVLQELKRLVEKG